MRGTKKFIGIIISLSILFSCFFSFGADAADGFSVFSTGATAHTGETVTISIKNTEVSLGSYSVYVNYDKTKLQYKSSSLGDAGSALPQASCTHIESDSQVRYAGATSSQNNVQVKAGTVMTITFLVIGNTSGSTPVGTPISVYAAAYDSSAKSISVTSQGNSVLIMPSSGNNSGQQVQNNVTEAPVQQNNSGDNSVSSSDATLKSMRVYGITDAGETTVDLTLSPEFSSDTLFYNASVMSDVARIQVDAVPNNEKAQVSIPMGYLKMDIGSNTTKITVTAEDGVTTMTYILTTVKSESGTSIIAPVETEPYTEGLSDELMTEVTAAEPETQNNAIASSADNIKNAVKNHIKNETFVIIGVTSGIVAVILAVTAAALFNKTRKKEKPSKDKNES